MIKYINCQEISLPILVKIRSHPDATAEDLINYLRSATPKRSWLFTLVPMTLQIKSTPCRKLEK